MKYLKPLFNQFKALKPRERALTVAAFLGVLYFLFDLALIRPQQAQAKSLRETIVRQDAELAMLNKAMATLATPAHADPLARQRAERDALQATFAQAESVIAHASANVRTAEVVRTLVAARAGLTLVSLKTLPVDTFFRGSVAAEAPMPPARGRTPPVAPSGVRALPVSMAAAPPPPLTSDPMPPLYRHGIEVVVKGTYASLVPYLRELERDSGGIFWGDVRMEVGAFPEATLRMRIYTLSARQELPLG